MNKFEESMARLRSWFNSSEHKDDPYRAGSYFASCTLKEDIRTVLNPVMKNNESTTSCPHCGKSTKPQTYGEEIAKTIIFNNFSQPPETLETLRKKVADAIDEGFKAGKKLAFEEIQISKKPVDQVNEKAIEALVTELRSNPSYGRISEIASQIEIGKLTRDPHFFGGVMTY